MMMNAMHRRHLTDPQRATLKATLLARRDQLATQLATHQGGESRVEHAHTVLTQDSDDATQHDSDREIDLVLNDFDSRTLAEVSQALRRIDEPGYGLCQSCGVEIPFARLQVAPEADRCVACESELEPASPDRARIA